MVRLTTLVEGLPASVPFVGPEAQERARGAVFAARLGANENVFGPSPLAVEAMRAAAGEIWQYADPEAHELRHALAELHEVAPANVMIGEGIDGLLGYLCRMVVGSGVKVVTSAGAYPTFNYHVAGYGGDLVTVPYAGDFEDPVALIEKAAEVGASLIYFANPDNPMGTVHSPEVVEAMIERVPEGCLLVLDEAYGEFADALPSVSVDDPRVVRMRTFSKAYGMAGARVGYALGEASLINAFNKIRNHFGMNRAAMAGALAAVQDQEYLQQVIANVAEGRARIGRIAHAQGLSVVPSSTNFVAIDCGQDGAFARRVLQGLVEENIFVRMPFVAPQDRCIRVSVGRPADLDVFETAFAKTLAAMR